jgi:hypothetical protein
MWRELTRVRVPERPEGGGLARQWTMALELVGAGKLVKLEVLIEEGVAESGTWRPKAGADPLTADGDFQKLLKEDARLLPTAPYCALIARIGGGTADQPVIPDQGTVPASLFAVGRKCIFQAPTTPVGSLFFAPNVPLAKMSEVEGTLLVAISEAL